MCQSGVVYQPLEQTEFADAGYAGKTALEIIGQHGYIPHVKGWGQEANELKRDPAKKARRWLVEVGS